MITKKSLADDPNLQSVLSDSGSKSNKQLGTLQLTNEEINPVSTSLQTKVSEKNLTLSKLNGSKTVENNKITAIDTIFADLEKRLNNESIDSSESRRLLDGLHASFVILALELFEPISPKKALNLALSFVIGC
ncbi:uncharacterized protein involved in exopolysaccharide biosynthesis [Paenibacillus sp. V4I3]|uniref:hypothetical protein n=1 Tax=Paenibacillus sp. V4I3 TaxID=3042305 RepID=UPI00278161CC|nr:hypothetical protein [Paenibacillus sp. V4I3]MDQ0873147.1 uncharacterized protein involved in exopolysaccharide biosynthesis [Paenibacillus sp. V4I3]